ncbi:MAG: 4'-phosphopantetheinyl transferase superfamily protein [Arcicella sp.]|nr:4'-phosphopantetheinyl transferase superfamily protein [Arcicella sp.]
MQETIAKYHRWEDAQMSVFGKLLLIKALQDFKSKSDLEDILYSPYMRPCLCEQLDFNISHSNNYIVCVISNQGRVGIDIEKCKIINFEDYHSCMNSKEWRDIEMSENPITSFFEYWTKKEAVMKGSGEGFGIDLNSICLDNEGAWLDDEYWFLRRVDIQKTFITHLATEYQLVEEPQIESLNLKDFQNICIHYLKKSQKLFGYVF